MPTFTADPIGPRSVDEMLDVVYERAAVAQRRRTSQRIGGAIAAMVLAVVGALTLQGSDEGAQVRLVDDPQQDRGQERQEGQAAPGAAAGETAAPGPPKDATPTTSAVRTATPPPVPPPAAGPPVSRIDSAPVTLRAISDPTGDAQPNDWYFDITSSDMVYDRMASKVVFTTKYRSSDSSGDRTDRRMETVFSYDGNTYAVRVDESGNELGDVHVDDNPTPCGSCVATFDEEADRLLVHVPVPVINDAIARKGDSPAFGAGVRIDGLFATSSTLAAGERAVDADTAGEAPR